MTETKTGRADRYKQTKEVSVDIVSVVINKKDENVATIRIISNLKDKSTSNISQKTKVITLSYEFMPMSLNAKTRLENPLGFLVTSYRIDEEIL